MAPLPDLIGKNIVVTGATSGIGRRAAERIAATGATMTLVGRNPDKLMRAIDEIRAATGNDAIDSLTADLSLIRDTHRVAGEIRARYDQLHVLVNNAGGWFQKRQETEEGLEMTFALNHMAYFVLTTELTDLLVASAPARVVSTSSDAHRSGRLNFDDLQLTKGYQSFRAYAASKLMNLLFTRELARRLMDTGVTANCLHPGFVSTDLAHNNGSLFRLAAKGAMLFARSVETGAKGAVYLATSPEVEGLTGDYYMDHAPRRTAGRAQDMDHAARLWELSEAIKAEVLGRKPVARAS